MLFLSTSHSTSHLKSHRQGHSLVRVLSCACNELLQVNRFTPRLADTLGRRFRTREVKIVLHFSMLCGVGVLLMTTQKLCTIYYSLPFISLFRRLTVVISISTNITFKSFFFNVCSSVAGSVCCEYSSSLKRHSGKMSPMLALLGHFTELCQVISSINKITFEIKNTTSKAGFVTPC